MSVTVSELSAVNDAASAPTQLNLKSTRLRDSSIKCMEMENKQKLAKLKEVAKNFQFEAQGLLRISNLRVES